MAINMLEIIPKVGKYRFEYEESIFGGRLNWEDLNIPKKNLDEYVKNNPYPQEETFYGISSLYEDFTGGAGIASITVGSEEGKEWVDNLVNYIWENYWDWGDKNDI